MLQSELFLVDLLRIAKASQQLRAGLTVRLSMILARVSECRVQLLLPLCDRRWGCFCSKSTLRSEGSELRFSPLPSCSCSCCSLFSPPSTQIRHSSPTDYYQEQHLLTIHPTPPLVSSTNDPLEPFPHRELARSRAPLLTPMFAPSGSAEGANKPSGPPKTFFSMLSSTPSSTPTLFGGPSTLAPPPRDSNGLTTTTARGDHHASDHGLDVTMADASTSGAGSSSKGLTLAPAMSGRLQFGAMPVASSSRVKERDLFVPFDGPSLAFGARAASKTTPREYGPDEIEDWRSDQIEAKQSEVRAVPSPSLHLALRFLLVCAS